MTILFQHGQKILFIGDSITEAGRSQTYPLGNGFVHECQKNLMAAYPELNLSIINRGISGDTTWDLLNRWERDVILVQPDWLFIKIGINDVWSVFEGFYREEINLEDFTQNYQRLIQQAQKQTNARIVLIEPFLVEKSQNDPFKMVLSFYQEKIFQLTESYDLNLVKLQQAFDKGLNSQPAGFWAEDRVHPTSVGHVLIALIILKACGFGFYSEG